MQDNEYKTLFEYIGKTLTDFGVNDIFIKENAHNIDPLLMAKYNEATNDVFEQKEKLDKLELELKNMIK